MISTLKRLQDKKAAQEINGGFTLIELLIVIVVLGILAAVVVFSLGSVTSKSAVSACQADGATINTAMAAFNANNGAYPTTVADLLDTTKGGPYLQSWPANYAHYTFVMTDAPSAAVAASGSVAAIPAYPAGSLFVKKGTVQVTTTTTSSVTTVTGADLLTAGWTPWVGSAACVTANVQ